MRNGTIDFMRLVAAGGIVMFHAQAPGQAFGLAGLHFFLMLIPVLHFASSGPPKTIAETVSEKASRLLLPWLTWSAIFGSLKLAEVASTNATLEQEFFLWMLATGPAIHLWFLPFAFIASVICSYLVTPFRALVALSSWSGPMVALASLSVAVIIAQTTDPYNTPPLAQYLAAFPALLSGFAFASLTTIRQKALLCAMITGVAAILGWTNGLLQLSVASAALLFCAAVPRKASLFSSLAASISLTVYLAHPLVLSVLERATGFQYGALNLGVIGLAITITLAFFLSFTLADRRVPPSLRRLVG